ncbi:hypothetical protein [Collimonas antrihumi]|uniref:hypothetical protein n=1 Tax=Collimonas antrihumi TaxID=1940615 RepID=UPI001B8A9602|nr:hypothetical protein [Collimonas antrihumi]
MQQSARTQAELCDTLEAMTIKQTIDHGFALVHFGDIAGQPTIAISTCRGDGGGFIIQ